MYRPGIGFIDLFNWDKYLVENVAKSDLATFSADTDDYR